MKYSINDDCVGNSVTFILIVKMMWTLLAKLLPTRHNLGVTIGNCFVMKCPLPPGPFSLSGIGFSKIITLIKIYVNLPCKYLEDLSDKFVSQT